jgi:hypothetical protein
LPREPFGLPGLGLERSLVGEPYMIAEELQAAGMVRGDQHLQKQPAEQRRENLHRQEIARSARDPYRVYPHVHMVVPGGGLSPDGSKSASSALKSGKNEAVLPSEFADYIMRLFLDLLDRANQGMVERPHM